MLVTALEATSTGHSIAQQLFHPGEADTSRPQLASRDDMNHAQPAAVFFQWLHGEPTRSLPLDEATGFSLREAELCWKHFGTVL